MTIGRGTTAEDFRAVAVEIRHASDMLDKMNLVRQHRRKNMLIGFDLEFLASVFDDYADDLEQSYQ